MKLFLLILIIIFTPFLSWTKNSATPTAAFNNLLDSAKNRDLDAFLECCDIEYLSGIKSTPENKQKIKESLRKDVYRKKYINSIMKYLSENDFEIITETRLDFDLTLLLIKVKRSDQMAKILFRKNPDGWKLAKVKFLNQEK